MSVPLNYPDTITLMRTEPSNYGGDEDVVEEEEVSCIFLQSTGWTQGAQRREITSDAVAYVDPSNQFVLDNANRLEGMLVLAELFGVTRADAWFRVIDVTVNRDHLLNNQIDNIELALKKSSRPKNVS